MLEIPESYNTAKQLNSTIIRKRIKEVEANRSPHKFAWFFGDFHEYGDLLRGKVITKVNARSGMIEICAEECRLVFADGASIGFYQGAGNAPQKNQLYIEFEDQSALIVTVQMYGGIWAFRENEFQNSYYDIAGEKPSPLTDNFDYDYFCLLRDEKAQKLSAKAFLATEQRIPGLGNGVLQDILLNAGIHPKRKIAALSEKEYKILFTALKTTLRQMTERGGRDTERDLFGNYGGYSSLLSKKTVGKPCPFCGSIIEKANYMGGSIYYCPCCQKEK